MIKVEDRYNNIYDKTVKKYKEIVLNVLDNSELDFLNSNLLLAENIKASRNLEIAKYKNLLIKYYLEKYPNDDLKFKHLLDLLILLNVLDYCYIPTAYYEILTLIIKNKLFDKIKISMLIKLLTMINLPNQKYSLNLFLIIIDRIKSSDDVYYAEVLLELVIDSIKKLPLRENADVKNYRQILTSDFISFFLDKDSFNENHFLEKLAIFKLIYHNRNYYYRDIIKEISLDYNYDYRLMIVLNILFNKNNTLEYQNLFAILKEDQAFIKKIYTTLHTYYKELEPYIINVQDILGFRESEFASNPYLDALIQKYAGTKEEGYLRIYAKIKGYNTPK